MNYTEESLIYALNACEEEGLSARIRLHSSLTKTAGYNVFTDKFPNIHGNLDEYPALVGFHIVDEPSWSQLDVVETVYVPWFNDNYTDSGLEFFVNMLSGYSTAMGSLRDANGEVVTNNGTYYNKYGLYEGNDAYNIKTFQTEKVVLTAEEKATFLTVYHNKWLGILATVNSANKCFSHDCYPFFDNQAGYLQSAEDDTSLLEGYETYVLDDWFARSLNMAIKAAENGYKFGAHIQAFDQGGETYPDAPYRLPTTAAEIKWQVYLNIAMGAKLIDYFGYDNNSGGSYMTLAGQPLPMYYLVQETNAELDAVDHVFASFHTWVGVKTFTPAGSAVSNAFQKVADMELASLTGVSNLTTDRELVVGEMIDGNGNHGYMLVGYDDPLNGNSTQVEMNFDGADGFIVYRGGERTLVEATEGALALTLSAGEGVFVIPVYMENTNA